MATKKFSKPPKKMKAIKDTKGEYGSSLPSIYFGEDQLPDIKEWTVGKEYSLEVKVKMTSHSIEEYGDKKGKMSARFNITAVSVDNDTDETSE